MICGVRTWAIYHSGSLISPRREVRVDSPKSINQKIFNVSRITNVIARSTANQFVSKKFLGALVTFLAAAYELIGGGNQSWPG